MHFSTLNFEVQDNNLLRIIAPFKGAIMIPIQFIKTELAKHNIDDVIEQIYS